MSLITKAMLQFAAHMKRHANSGVWDGSLSGAELPYFEKARRLHQPSGTSIIFSRDATMHSSGWFKNPDYERCYHLSLAFHDLQGGTSRPFEPKLAEAWVRAFYGDWTRYVWQEGTSEKGKSFGLSDICHYRVFCDPAWQPIIPRGEVYTRDFIEKGWLSWSDQQHEKRKGKS